jgi:SAM-dependent methyltransferase
MLAPSAAIDPWFGNHRTLAQQLVGLEPALERASGRAVLDLGCAEGDIAGEFLRRGAALAHGCEALITRVEAARRKFPAAPAVFFSADLEDFDGVYDRNRDFFLQRYDIVLLLAILQKMREPQKLLNAAVNLAGEALAIRLPKPVIDDARSGNVPFDVPQFLRACHLREIRGTDPRGDYVAVWTR